MINIFEDVVLFCAVTPIVLGLVAVFLAVKSHFDLKRETYKRKLHVSAETEFGELCACLAYMIEENPKNKTEFICNTFRAFERYLEKKQELARL